MPLHARVCAACFLVQLDEVVPAAKLFSDYAYFSSYSASWVAHASRFAEMARRRFSLDADSLVVEVASNDGYLLRHFLEGRRSGARHRGPRPMSRRWPRRPVSPRWCASSAAMRAASSPAQGSAADLIVANNVLAHVPDLHGFVAGLAALVRPDGVVSLEFPHLLRLIEGVQFDTIYHEHFSYFSVLALEPVLARHGLRIFDAEELPTHGGSLRLFACREGGGHGEGPGLATLRATERAAGLDRLETYAGFAGQVAAVRSSLLGFLENARRYGKSVAAYGAAAKGNTLLNHCGIDRALVDYVVDASPHKQGRYLPGSRLPIHAPGRLAETRPDYVLILPWNLRDEITATMAVVGDWGGRFVVPVPRTEVLP